MGSGSFGQGYEKYTDKNELNLIGISIRYFSRINIQWKDDTQKDYRSNYANNIFPNVDVNLAAKDYDKEKIEELLSKIQINAALDEGTIESKIRHLVLDPLKVFFHDNKDLKNPFLSDSDLIEELPVEEIEEKLMKLKKSFSKEEELKVCDALLKNPNHAKGELFGLAVIFIAGTRNNEACGLNFGDIQEFEEHPGAYYLQVYKSTQINTNRLKASGKTYNSPRRIPIPKVLLDTLMRRKQFVEKNTVFPVIDKNGELIAESIDEMPISCRGERLAVRCSSGDLSIAGKSLFKKLFKDDRTTLLDYAIKHDDSNLLQSDQLDEKDPTTYLLRRNMATHIRHLGFDAVEIEYYMGHKIENSSIRRRDFCDEDFLYRLWEKVKMHPLNLKYVKF